MKWLLRSPMLVVLAGGLLLAGCAKRSTEAPPTPTSTPPAPSSTGTPPAPDSPSSPSETPAPGSDQVIAQLQPAYFEYDSYSLNEPARSALDGNARVLRDHRGVAIVIEGHTDERGTSEYNQALGERRAMAARDYLTAAGIEASRLRVISYGKERPFANASDEASWTQNRRAHFSGR